MTNNVITARKIELLAPAKNADYGMEAILHGADAVYIGAPMFGARAAAGNTIEEIEQLAQFAHQYHARVYVTMNTILQDDDLPKAKELILRLYNIGVDAIIVQDMGLLQLDLPPIALHASTQMDNRTKEKALFLEKAGFSQIVLARELSIHQINEICQAVSTPIEVFVHGALCVSYSGQCYLSNALTGRSANKGTCSQPCRLPYNITDSEGKRVASNQHALSMKDLNRLDNLEELLDAGVSSLKIEGRLKDLTYLKNTVLLYRTRLDEILSRRHEYQRASSGSVRATFVPNLQKTFNRGFTDYFLYGRKDAVWSVDTPKSIGEYIGTVTEVTTKYIRIRLNATLNNGDGLCFMNSRRELEGIQVNRVDGDCVYPLHVPAIKKGTKIYRNSDHSFIKLLSRKTAERKIEATIRLREVENGFLLQMEDEDGFATEIMQPMEKTLAIKPQDETIKSNLSRTGNTIFSIYDVILQISENFFIPSSTLSEWRRQLTDNLLNVRLNGYERQEVHRKPTIHAFPLKELTYLGNVSNQKAKLFYEQHNAKVIQPAFEIQQQTDVPLMFTRHCVKQSLGWCPKEGKGKHPYAEPFFLTNERVNLRLEFDCKKCEMRVYQA